MLKNLPNVNWIIKAHLYYHKFYNEENLTIELYEKYKELADSLPNIYFGGRLGTYSYYNMDVIVEKALQLVDSIKAK